MQDKAKYIRENKCRIQTIEEPEPGLKFLRKYVAEINAS
jgi:hypothetical protein